MSKAAKTLSDKTYRDAGDHWEKSIDQDASRAEDFGFGVQGARSMRSGMVWMSAFEWSQLDPQRRGQLSPHEVGLVVRSSETNARGAREVKFLVKRDSLGESMLIDCLANVAARAEYDEGENLFFNRRAVDGTGRKRRVSRMIAGMVKDCAERFGLPRKQFSTKSFKIGGISSLKTLGVSQEGMQQRMDHRTASASRHYQRPVLGESQGPLAGGAMGFSTSSVRAEMRISAGRKVTGSKGKGV